MEEDGTRPRAARANGTLGPRVRRIRKELGLTLAGVSEATGVSISAISKIENDQVSPTFANLMRLAEGLDIPLSRLVSLDSEDRSGSARLTVTRAGDAKFRTTQSYDIWALCTDIQHKRMLPMVERVRSRDPDTADGMLSHSGEEFVYVLKGTVAVHTEHYEPVRLERGDSLYMDSQMAHTYTTVGAEDAEILMVWLSPAAQSSSDSTRMVESLLSRRA